jgi:pSer/pThr/pTyr-binding forkhead associated (FHA) protein
MARLLVRTGGLGIKAIELRLGVNRVGRDRDCEICLTHNTVSTHHAELALSSDGVYLRDTQSTNGTFLNGERIAESWLVPGNEIKFGDIELTVESTDAIIAIPEFERGEPAPAAPVILENGLTACPRHTGLAATFRCTVCHDLMCNRCVRVLKLKGGVPRYHCRLCSNPCERVEEAFVKKKKGFLEKLQDTVMLKFNHRRDK